MFPAITSVIVTTKSPLQASISSACGQFVAFICKGRVFSRSPYEYSDSGASISSSMVAESKSGDESVFYAVFDDAIVDILSTI